MNLLKMLGRFLFNRESRWLYLVKLGVFNGWEDEKYIRRRFKYKLGYEPNLKQPKTFNEKLNWLKLNDRNPYYTAMVDKYEVKKIVADKIGEEYVVPPIGVYDSFDDIPFEKLPNSFVLKCTHDSGPIIVKDKRNIDKDEVRKIISQKLKQDYYMASREWPYKNVKRRILAEEMLPGLGKLDSVEYKITTCNGKVKMITVCTGIAHSALENRKNDHFDVNWNPINMWAYYKNSGRKIERPQNLDEIISISEKLAEGIPQVRVDLYDVNGHLYFGEMTFFTWGGFIEFNPPEYDKIMGEWIQLPIDREK